MFAVLARLFRDAASRVGEPTSVRGSPRRPTSAPTRLAAPRPRRSATFLGNRPAPEPIRSWMSWRKCETEAKPIVTRNQALGWLRQMMLIRRFEERAEMMYQKQKIGGFFHQYSGQEPVAVGSIGVLREDDYVITAYRDHGHALARGMERQGGDGRAAGQGDRLLQGQGRLDALLRRREGLPRRPRDRRQPHPAGRRGRLRDQVPRRGPRLHLLLRRRRHEPGVGPRGLQHGRALEAAGHLHRREQPVRDGHLAGPLLGRPRPDRPRRDRLRHPGRLDQRQRHRADGQDHPRGRPTAPAPARGRRFIEAQTYRFKGHSISDPAKYRAQGRARRGARATTRSSSTRTCSRSAAGSTRTTIERIARGASSTRSTRASSSPSRASRRPSRPSTKTSRWPRIIPQE